ncbi:UNVERIFIED_CONTAM: hypothetical protein PYX00_006328 [Menopon gallinae]|uniref:Cilia- and flagella-associated protein 91 n=1 Tax=Menopon gallinae TaxID=328185 RepID=A0AAW2HVR1_9NEOP
MPQTSVVPIGRKFSVLITRSKGSSKRDKATQTVFRDSEAQTLPWMPEVIFRRRADGARIPQDFLPPGEGPFDLGDLLTIERSRQKQAWEGTLPRTASKRNDMIRLSCVTSIAENEIAFREGILDANRGRRLEEFKETMKDARERMLMSLKNRLEKMKREKWKENTMIFKFWNRKFRRKMRKLKMNHLTQKIGKSECESSVGMSGPVSDVASKEAWRPSPLIKDEVGFSRYLAEFSGIELLEKQIGVSRQAKFTKPRKPSRTSKICSRVLRNAENEFEQLRLAQKGKQSEEVENRLPREPLRKRLWYSGMLEEDLREMEKEEEAFQAALLLGKIVKGRAVQTQLLSNLMEFRARESDSRQDEVSQWPS